MGIVRLIRQSIDSTLRIHTLSPGGLIDAGYLPWQDALAKCLEDARFRPRIRIPGS